MSPERSLGHRLAAEALGAAFLLMAIVGSGIFAVRLAGGVEGTALLVLLANTLPTAAILVVLIWMFARLSGAHFNPAVTLAFFLNGEIRLPHGLAYMGAQLAGGLAGVLLAHLMFQEPALSTSLNDRSDAALWLSEFIATFGLVMVIFMVRHARESAVAPAVGLYIGAAIWFTASTGFANPAVTLARMFTDSYTGIAPAGVPGFLLAEVAGGLAGILFFRWITGEKRLLKFR